MRMQKLFIKHFSFFPILYFIIQQLSSASCASLEIKQYSPETFNASSNQSTFKNPTNLSELIEYSPISLEDDLRDWEQRKKDAKIIKVRLRASLTVGNNENETVILDKLDGIMHPNASETPLSEIEFQDKFVDFLVYKPFSKRVARTISVNNETDILFDSDEGLKSSEEDSSNAINSAFSSSDEDLQAGRSIHFSKYALGRQFVFPPYTPVSPFTYDKDTPSDEKVSFHDVLPVKAMKFIKSMVEEADWNGMFKSMVRTVVDHFVNKIIEKMFSEKDHHDHFKKRSLDGLFTPGLSLSSFQVRLKRSTNASNPIDHIKDIFSMPAKRARQELDVVKKKNAQEGMSWFDQFLDYVFPNQNPDKSDYDSSGDRLKKRDTVNSEFLKILLELFLNTFEKSSEFIKDAKDVLLLKMLKEFSPYFNKHGIPNSSFNHVDAMKMSHRKFEKNIPHLYDVANYVSSRSMRRRRSTGEYFRKMEDRLWQFHSHRHRPHSYSSREDCSLRKACNAGRLLARFPSIQDITLQLSNGNEPHWDALIWGMKKKGCSRVFCKRQRSPKGSKYSWNNEKERHTKRILIVTHPPETFSETGNLTA